MPTMTTAQVRARKRDRAMTRARTVFLVRTQPEMFAPHVVEAVQASREATINAIGDVYDWDCHRCRRAVLTYSLSDPCPRCHH